MHGAGWTLGGGVTDFQKGHEGTFWGGGNALQYVGMVVTQGVRRQLPSICALKTEHFIVCKLYINYF